MTVNEAGGRTFDLDLADECLGLQPACQLETESLPVDEVATRRQLQLQSVDAHSVYSCHLLGKPYCRQVYIIRIIFIYNAPYIRKTIPLRCA